MNTYNQAAFDIAFTHLAAQGERSVRDDGVCQYRDGLGRMCGIGPLIPDSIYSDSMEGGGVCMVLGAVAKKLGGAPSLDLLELIQRVHDDYFVDAWEAAARECAEAFGISTKVIDALDWSRCAA